MTSTQHCLSWHSVEPPHAETGDWLATGIAWPAYRRGCSLCSLFIAPGEYEERRKTALARRAEHMDVRSNPPSIIHGKRASRPFLGGWRSGRDCRALPCARPFGFAALTTRAPTESACHGVNPFVRSRHGYCTIIQCLIWHFCDTFTKITPRWTQVSRPIDPHPESPPGARCRRRYRRCDDRPGSY